MFLELDSEDTDKYGRMLAYVWLEAPTEISQAEIRAKLFNARLVLDGYANLMTIPPNVKYVDYLKGYEAEAREADKGLWAAEKAEVARIAAEKAAAAAAAVPKPAPAPSPAAPSGGGTVYITKTGAKYHQGGCSYLSQSKIPIGLADAEAQGYTPCSRCY